MSKTRYDIQKVVILGSGVMGSQIAAHCVNAGLDVWLLDLKSDDPERPDKLVEESIKKLTGMNPSPLALPEYAERIQKGNFEDDLELAGEADWVCEAIVERMDIKKEMMSKLEEVWTPGTLVSSNTSGLPISEIGEDCSEAIQKHFLGTHFFNPPRYMKLLEMIPTQKTDPAVLDSMRRFCEKILGKGVVLCKDTPNFIGNRMGVFSMASVMRWYFDGSLSAAGIDRLTGTLTGYSKAATFRTCDIVGLDVLKHVAENLYPAIPDDERREIFKLPEGFQKMVDREWLGNKAGQGFYKKVKTGEGKEYHALNPETMEYEPQSVPDFDSVNKAQKEFKTPEERLNFLVRQEDLAGRFLWEIHCDLLLYAAHRIPGIADSVEAVDRAMQWGLIWELCPFQRWDAIGVQESVERMEAEGREVPDSIRQMIDKGRENFYENGTVYNLATGEVEKLTPPAAGAVTVSLLNSEDKEVWGNDAGGLYDMDDGVALFEFRTKNKTLGSDLVRSLNTACEKVSENFDALVVGHDQDHFSYGADLTEVLKAIREEDFQAISKFLGQFQEAAVGLRIQPFPVVAAVSGRTFGGGAEMMMHCDRVVAHHELYCGLVELGVGLIPAGGGTKEMLLRAMQNVLEEETVDPIPYLKEAFKTIGMAKVSDGAPKARKLGFLRESDRIVMNRDLLLVHAKKQARLLADEGYRPPLRPKIKLSGKTGYAALKLMIYTLKESKFIGSYDAVLAEKVARVLTGGDLSEPVEVPESYVLKLEREAIRELYEDKRTLKRMESVINS
ncbi:MAG: 3-hydroxyacyl-CoA dehydrogenase/enoyl-CoA hydratase family protein [Balneolaceae bacterium]